jgi:hypothetical protein
LAARVFDAHVGGIEEAGASGDDLHTVSRQLGLGDIDFGLDDLGDAKAQVRHGDLFLDVIVGAVDALELEAGEVHDGFAHGLAGDSARIDTGTTYDFALFDHRHAAAALGALNGRTLSGGAGADDDDVEFLHEGDWPQMNADKRG